MGDITIQPIENEEKRMARTKRNMDRIRTEILWNILSGSCWLWIWKWIMWRWIPGRKDARSTGVEGQSGFRGIYL